MHRRVFGNVMLRWLALASTVLFIGCYTQPSAERLDYDAETVEMLRAEIKSVDWDE